MANNFELEATKREISGKGNARRLRRLEGLMPAIIYGGNTKPKSISIIHNNMVTAFKNEAFFSHILTLSVDGKKEQVVIKDIQRHPYKNQLLHIDFLRVTATEAITIKVPLHFIGEKEALGVKTGGLVSHLIKEVEIKCLPKDLPTFINIDISKLELGQSILLSQINIPKKLELVQLSHGEENDLPVVSIHKVKTQAIVDDAPAEAQEASSKDEDPKKETSTEDSA